MTVYALGDRSPVLGEGVWVAPNATVVGDVVLGAASSVWFGATLRADFMPIRVGARTNIQDGAVVHVTGGEAMTTIGDGVTVGHLAIVHGCTVGAGSLVGMGSIVLDGAILEEECFVAAGALVPPGMRVPTRSLVVGRPAKVIRPLEASELAKMRSAAEVYASAAGQYRTALGVRS